MADPVSIGIFVGAIAGVALWRLFDARRRRQPKAIAQGFPSSEPEVSAIPILDRIKTGLARIGKKAFSESLAAILLLIFASILVAAYFWIWFQETFTEKPRRKTPRSKHLFPALPDDQPRDDRELFELPLVRAPSL
jgi:hypothetical protein